ncbi:MAG: Fe2+-dependent dioxygenase [Rivihabitans pingtungensis]
MLLHVSNVLTHDELRQVRQLLAEAPWEDGRHRRRPIRPGQTQSATGANLATGASAGQPGAGGAEPQCAVFSAALPNRIFPPMFNCYQGGMTFGNHVDNAVRNDPFSGQWLRTDVSCTLFFTDPDEYQGGELIVEDTYGSHAVKLPAGDMILYPSTSVHRVEPVTAGARLASFFWTQSMIRDDNRRAMLFDMDSAISSLRQRHGDSEETVNLTSVYHNLLRQWSEV